MSNVYAVIDGSGNVVNMVVWDGNAEHWQPPAGETAVLATPDAQIGGKYSGGVFTLPAPRE